MRLRKKILNPSCPFFPLTNIRNKKMKSWTHPASPTVEQNQEPPTFPSHNSPTFPTLPPHYHPIFLTLRPSYPPLPFSLSHLPFHLTIFPPCPPYHLATLPPFLPSHFTTPPPTSKALQNSNSKPSVSPQTVFNRRSTISEF